MKISRQSADRLTLRSLSWTTWVMSGVLMGVGLGTGALLMGRSTFDCDRTQSDQCTITHDYLLRYRTESFPLVTLQGAEVQTAPASDSNDTYRLLLLTREGPVPFTQSFSSNWSRYTSQANQVTRFVQTPSQPQVRLHQDSRWLGLLVLLSFGGVGLLMLINNKVVTGEFNKSTNTFTLCQWGLTGVNRYSIPLQQIAGLRAEFTQGGHERSSRELSTKELNVKVAKPFIAQDYAADDSDDDTCSARLSIVLKNGAAVPLTRVYAGDPERQEQYARQISEFLRLPPLPAWNASAVIRQQVKIALALLTGGKEKQRTAVQTSQTTLRQDHFNVEAYQRMATALSMLDKKDAAKRLLETARARCQSQGEFDKAAHLDHVLALLRLKDRSKWWDAV